MPTVELARLKQETAELSAFFAQPDIFVRELERLLQNYAVPVHRQGKAKGVVPILKSYEVPPLLMKHLELELTHQTGEQPEQSLAVADALWTRRTIQTRQLAARMLGGIQAQPGDLEKRVRQWADENREQVLAPELARQAVLGLCRQYPDELIDFAAELLGSEEFRLQSLGLGALSTLLNTVDYANLPRLFELLAAPVQAAERKLRPQLAEALVALARLSPQETEFFLQQALANKPNEGTLWVARQAAKALPVDNRQRLHALL